MSIRIRMVHAAAHDQRKSCFRPYLLLEVFLARDGAENVEHQTTVGTDIVVSVDRDDVQRVEVDEVVRPGHDLPLPNTRKLPRASSVTEIETIKGFPEAARVLTASRYVTFGSSSRGSTLSKSSSIASSVSASVCGSSIVCAACASRGAASSAILARCWKRSYKETGSKEVRCQQRAAKGRGSEARGTYEGA